MPACVVAIVSPSETIRGGIEAACKVRMLKRPQEAIDPKVGVKIHEK